MDINEQGYRVSVQWHRRPGRQRQACRRDASEPVRVGEGVAKDRLAGLEQHPPRTYPGVPLTWKPYASSTIAVIDSSRMGDLLILVELLAVSIRPGHPYKFADVNPFASVNRP